MVSSTWLRAAALVLLAPSALAIKNDFSAYPASVQSCLYKAADEAQCTSGALADLNSCLCGNGSGFLTKTGQCIGQNGSSDVENTWAELQTNCNGSKTPLGLDEAQFKEAVANGAKQAAASSSAPASSAASTKAAATSASSTSTATSSGSHPSQTTSNSNPGSHKSSSGGLSTGAIVGIAVGAGVGGAALVAILAWLFIRRRRRNTEESHPMLPNQQQSPAYPSGTPSGAPTTYPPTEPTPVTSEVKTAWSPGPSATGPSPDPSQQWSAAPYSTPSPPGYPPHQQQQVPPMQQQHHPTMYEMDASSQPSGFSVAAEMPGSTPSGGR